jgi:ABC-type transporter Mla subunit MlaD
VVAMRGPLTKLLRPGTHATLPFPSRFPRNQRMLSAKHRQSVAETSINMIDALRGQQEQLKRLLKQKILISDAPKATLSEIEAQITELKRLLAQLESDIQDQLRRGA